MNIVFLRKETVPVFQFAISKKKALQKQRQALESVYTLPQALRLIRAHAISNFNETVDCIIRLGVDPKHGEQIVRGTCKMPAGLGKNQQIAIFVADQYKQIAVKAGADVIGDDDLLKKIKEGVCDFDLLYATQDMISTLKPFARTLGPKGLMPSNKLGTLIDNKNIQEAMRDAKMGQVSYRVDQGRNIHSPLGQMDFSDDQIILNLNTLMKNLSEQKPLQSKGQYFLEAYIKSTMGPSWKLNIDLIDPQSKTVISAPTV